MIKCSKEGSEYEKKAYVTTGIIQHAEKLGMKLFFRKVEWNDNSTGASVFSKKLKGFRSHEDQIEIYVCLNAYLKYHKDSMKDPIFVLYFMHSGKLSIFKIIYYSVV